METKIGKRNAIYLPKVIVRALGLKEGDRVLLSVSGDALIVERVYDPLQLALSGRKFASVTPEEVEAISLEEQKGHVEGST